MRYNSQLKREIYKKGYTIEAFANKTGISRHTIYNIEKQKHKTRDEIIECIADGLQIPFRRASEICQLKN